MLWASDSEDMDLAKVQIAKLEANNWIQWKYRITALLSGIDGLLDIVEGMTKESDRHSGTDSEAGSLRSQRGKVAAILCPVACALLLVSVFAVSFVGAKLAYEQYGALCAARRGFDVAKLYIFPNATLRVLKPA